MEKWKENLAVLWIAQVFSIMGFSFALPFAPFYLQELGVTDEIQIRFWTGLFASAAGLSMAIMTPLWGYLADRFGKKPMTLRASLGGTIALCAMGLVHSPQALLGLRVVQGMFAGTVTAYLTLVVSETPKERMGVAIGLMNSSVFLGNSISPLLGGIFADMFGYRASFFVASGLLLVSFLLCFLFVQEKFTPSAKTSFSFFSDLKDLVFHTGVLPIIGMIFLYGNSRTLQRPILPLVVQDLTSNQTNLATQTGVVTATAGFASVLAGLLIGTLVDRGRFLRIGVICGLCAAFFGMLIVFVTRVWQLSLLFFLAAFFMGGIDPILKVILTRLVPMEKRGAAFGLIGSARSFGWFTGSLSGGIVAAIFGLRSVFLVSAGLFAGMAVLLAMMGQRWPDKNEMMKKHRSQ